MMTELILEQYLDEEGNLIRPLPKSKVYYRNNEEEDLEETDDLEFYWR